MPEAKFPGPVIGVIFEGKVDGFSSEVGEVDLEFEPFGFDGFVGHDLVVEDFAVSEDAELPVAVGVVAAADLERVFFTSSEIDATDQAAGRFFVEGVGLNRFFVSETGERDDAPFTAVFDAEAGGDGLDGFIPLGAEVLIRFFVVLRRAADHASGDRFGEEGDGSVGRESEGFFGMFGDKGFEGEPEHAGDFGILDVFAMLGEGIEKGETVLLIEARDGGSEVEADGG